MLKARVDYSQLERKFKKLSKDLGKTAEQAIIELGQSSARQLAIATEPRGLSAKQKQISEDVINKDFNTAYDFVGQTYKSLRQYSQKTATAFAKAVQANNLQAAERYAKKYLPGFEMRESDDGGHMDSVRGARGRVKDNAQIMGIRDNAVLLKINDDKKKSIGFSKLGWLQAGKSLGAKTRIPKWIEKGRSYGSSKVDRKGWKTFVYLYNKISYATNLLTASKVRGALRTAYKNQISKMERAIKATCKKF